jgi:hypothetical protein
MTVPAGSEDPTNFYPSVGAGAVVYGDHDLSSGASYSAFLANAQQDYPADPWFFWDQPLTDSGWVRRHKNKSGPGAATPKGKNEGELVLLGTAGWLYVGAATLVLLHVPLFA